MEIVLLVVVAVLVVAMIVSNIAVKAAIRDRVEWERDASERYKEEYSKRRRGPV